MGVGAALIVVRRVVVSVVAGWLAHEISIMASAENTEVRIISFFIVCVVGFGKKVVLRSIHSYRIGKVIFPESDLTDVVPCESPGEGSSIHQAFLVTRNGIKTGLSSCT